MRLTPEQAVFAEALMDLGFGQVKDSFRILPYEGFDRIFGEDHVGQPGADRGSTIEVRIFVGRSTSTNRDHVEIQWITTWVRPPGGYPTFEYHFPEQWVYAMERLRQLIHLAEHKERTGETLLVEGSRGRV